MIVLCFLIAASCAARQPADNRPPQPMVRNYSEGPLTADDFQAPPKQLPREEYGFRPLAYTETDYTLEYKYRFTSRRGGRTTVRLTSVELQCVVARHKSWNKAKANKALLDHEQGHFDITEAHVRRARLKLMDLLRRNPPTATARSEEDAAKKLEEEIRKLIQPFFEASKKAHRQYDETTRHGTRPQAQAEYRNRQREELSALADGLKKKEKKKRSNFR